MDRAVVHGADAGRDPSVARTGRVDALGGETLPPAAGRAPGPHLGAAAGPAVAASEPSAPAPEPGESRHLPIGRVPVQPGPAQTGPVQPGHVASGSAQPGPARPVPTQPAPTHPASVPPDHAPPADESPAEKSPLDESPDAPACDALTPGAETPRRVVRRNSVRGQVLDALRSALVDGELLPGRVYSAPALAQRFGVSATPVREAMQQLHSEGAVEVVPNRGFRVLERSPRELTELAEVRALIEVPVMLELAQSVSAEGWTSLRPQAEATVRAAAQGDFAGYAECDRAFHRAVLSLSGNQQLVQVADDLHRRAQWPLVTGPNPRGRADLLADAAEHTALLDALVARDLRVVRDLVREHFAGAAR